MQLLRWVGNIETKKTPVCETRTVSGAFLRPKSPYCSHHQNQSQHRQQQRKCGDLDVFEQGCAFPSISGCMKLLRLSLTIDWREGIDSKASLLP
jgi:hypothetical protein